MENWSRTFLKRLEQELAPYREDCIFLEAEGNNPDTLRQYFSSSYSGTPETYSVPDGFESLEIRAVKGLDAVAEENGGSCVLSVEFTAPGEDSYTYLTAECVKENGEWKVLSYGLEK